MENFGSWLKAQLENKEISQADLAQRTNLDSAVISNLVNGRRGPGVETCNALAKALGLSPESVFRAAGFLPPINDVVEKRLEEWRDILRYLTEDEAEELALTGRLKIDIKRKAELRKQMQNKRLGEDD